MSAFKHVSARGGSIVWMGPQALFIHNAAFHIIFVIFIVWRLWQRPARPEMKA